MNVIIVNFKIFDSTYSIFYLFGHLTNIVYNYFNPTLIKYVLLLEIYSNIKVF